MLLMLELILKEVVKEVLKEMLRLMVILALMLIQMRPRQRLQTVDDEVTMSNFRAAGRVKKGNDMARNTETPEVNVRNAKSYPQAPKIQPAHWPDFHGCGST